MGSRAKLTGIRVLVVEDDRDLCELLRMLVMRHGAECETAANGEEALEKLLENPPHLVFSDVRMPLMDRYELVERMGREPSLARIPVIAITGLARRADLIRTWEAGFAGHLMKPVTAEAIAAQLKRVFWAHG